MIKKRIFFLDKKVDEVEKMIFWMTKFSLKRLFYAVEKGESQKN